MKKKVIKFGNSIGMSFGKVAVEITGFKVGDPLEVTCSKGKMIIKLDK